MEVEVVGYTVGDSCGNRGKGAGERVGILRAEMSAWRGFG